jgi:hypothetical protein
LENISQDNKDKQDEKKQDISAYLDFIKNEVDRAMKRKEVLENKAVVLGTLVSSIVSVSFFDNDIFSLDKNIIPKKIIIMVFFILSLILTYKYTYLVIKPSDYFYIKGKINVNEVLNSSKKKQEKTILNNYATILEKIHSVCDQKSEDFKKAIHYFSAFLILFIILYMLKN